MHLLVTFLKKQDENKEVVWTHIQKQIFCINFPLMLKKRLKNPSVIAVNNNMLLRIVIT